MRIKADMNAQKKEYQISLKRVNEITHTLNLKLRQQKTHMKKSEKEKTLVKISRDRALKLKNCAMKRVREHKAAMHR